MEMAVVFREGHCSLPGKIMRTIFHSIKLLHLAQLATHTKVKERDPFLYDREESRMCMKERAGDRSLNTLAWLLKIKTSEWKCRKVHLQMGHFLGRTVMTKHLRLKRHELTGFKFFTSSTTQIPVEKNTYKCHCSNENTLWKTTKVINKSISQRTLAKHACPCSSLTQLLIHTFKRYQFNHKLLLWPLVSSAKAVRVYLMTAWTSVFPHLNSSSRSGNFSASIGLASPLRAPDEIKSSPRKISVKIKHTHCKEEYRQMPMSVDLFKFTEIQYLHTKTYSLNNHKELNILSETRVYQIL